MVSACGSWYDVFFAKNKKYRVGHSALILVESITGNLRYFDFGRYHTPKDFGRVRDIETDGDVTIKTIAKIEKNQITNLKEILLEIKKKESFHGEGTLYASILNDVSYSKAYKYAKKILRRLGIEDQFLDIFEITKSNYIPKPMKSSLKKLIKQYELNPLETAYFDDLEKNLMSASLKGFTTIHISEKSSSESQAYIDFRFKTVINALDMISKVL